MSESLAGWAVRPLTSDHWPALVDLLDQGGPAGRCWCVAPMGIPYRRRPAEQNQADLKAVVDHGPPPGLLAFQEDLAVAWCRVNPRTDIPGVERNFRTARVDDLPVWCISCFYIRKGHRRAGLMSAMIGAAVEYARSQGAPAVEAFPLDGSVSPSATSTGYRSAFARAGFTRSPGARRSGRSCA